MRAKLTRDDITTQMTEPNRNRIANYIWGITGDVLCDVLVRGSTAT